jgi:disulfide bond formation protein DsbB
MATLTTKIEVRVAWWLKPYFYVLATIHALTGCEPNYERVQYWINRAITAKACK